MIRRLLALTIVFLALLAASASAQGLSPAASTLARCVETTGRLDVLFAIDESGSIRYSDPSNQRIAGVQAALSGFAHLTDGSGGERPVSIKVMFEGFAGLVTPNPDATNIAGEWQPLTSHSLPAVLDEAARIAAQPLQPDTDYALALVAARKLLAREAVAETEGGGSPPCKSIVWFTDGGYDITQQRVFGSTILPDTEPYAPGVNLSQPGGATRAESIGRQYLCRPGGLMDGLESDGVVKFSFGLTRFMSTYDRDFLDAVTTGQAGDVQCGSTLSPQTGEFAPVTSARCLFFIFGGLLDGTGCPPPKTPVCAEAACQRGLNAFRTLPGISRFVIQVNTGGSDIAIILRGPDGQQATFTPGSTHSQIISGATISQRWFSRSDVLLTSTLPESRGAWIGPWSYTFVAAQQSALSAVPISSVELYPGLIPQLSANRVVRGSTTSLVLSFRDVGGHPVTSGPLLDGSRPSATLSFPYSNQLSAVDVGARSGDGTYDIHVAVPSGSTSPFVLLNLTAPFVASTGAAIVPLRHTFELPVELGAGVPTVTPNSLSLASISGDGTSTGTLTVRASPRSKGCVWISSPSYRAPHGTHSVRTSVTPNATSASNCLSLAPGQSKKLRVSFTVRGAAVGTMNVIVPVHLRSALSGRSVAVTIAGSVELYPPRNIAKRVGVLVAAMVIGVLVPLLILLALNLYGARFTPPQSIQQLVLDVVLIPGQKLTKPGESSGRPEAPVREFDWVRKAGRDRPLRNMELDLTPTAQPDAPPVTVALHGLAARRPRDLFTGPSGNALAAGHILLLGSDGRVTTSTGIHPAEAPLRLPGTWMFAVTEISSAEDTFGGPGRLEQIRGRLVLLLTLSPAIGDGPELLEEAGRRLLTQDWAALIAAAGTEPRPGLLRRIANLLPHPHLTRASEDEGDDWPQATDEPSGWDGSSPLETGSPGAPAEVGSPRGTSPEADGAGDSSPPAGGRRF